MAGDKRNRKLLCAGERTEKILCATEECTPRSRGLWKKNLKNLKATTSKQKTPGSPGAFQKQKIHQPCSTKNLTNQTQFSKSCSSYSFPKPFSLKKFTLQPKPSTTSASSQAGETSSLTLSASIPTTHLSDADKFPNIKSLEGKTIIVTGQIKLYRKPNKLSENKKFFTL
jgi:hypothetical protein